MFDTLCTFVKKKNVKIPRDVRWDVFDFLRPWKKIFPAFHNSFLSL